MRDKVVTTYPIMIIYLFAQPLAFVPVRAATKSDLQTSSLKIISVTSRYRRRLLVRFFLGAVITFMLLSGCARMTPEQTAALNAIKEKAALSPDMRRLIAKEVNETDRMHLSQLSPEVMELQPVIDARISEVQADRFASEAFYCVDVIRFHGSLRAMIASNFNRSYRVVVIPEGKGFRTKIIWHSDRLGNSGGKSFVCSTAPTEPFPELLELARSQAGAASSQ